jgi:hypothetical protein
MVALYIALEPSDGDSITIARVSDRSLLIGAARTAIAEAFDQATQAAALDPNIGVLHQAEANRLSEALRKLIPELLLDPDDRLESGMPLLKM